MDHFAVNWLAIVLAVVVSMAIGAGWYMLLSRQWLAAIGKTKDQINSTDYTPYIWSVIVQLVTAYALALFTPNLFGDTNVLNGVLCAIHMWVAFVLTIMILNHRYQGQPWALTAIDGGYALVFLVAQGVVIGLLG